MGNQAGIIIRNVKNELFHSAKRLILNEVKGIECLPAIFPDMDLITYVTDRLGHDARYAIDSRKLQAELGWVPSLQFEEEIEKTVRWYLENEAWMDNITSGEYEKYYESMYGKR